MRKVNNFITRTIPMMLVTLVAISGTAQTAKIDRISGNKVAILPIHFIGEGSEIKSDEMRYRLQDLVYQYLSNRAMGSIVQDPVYTNVLLLRNGVKPENFRDFTPEELAEMLKVDYVLMGRVTQESAGEVTHNNRVREEHSRRGRSRSHSASVSRTADLTNTYIDINIYKSDGENIYAKSRKSILYDADAYRNGLHYLLKRSPLCVR